MTDVGLMELEKHHTWHGDERGEPRVCFGFQQNSGLGIIYLWGFQVDDLVCM
jgi:hypothetical protein